MDHHNNDWMQTYTGRAFSFSAPSPRDVDVRDIAHSLGMQCRYNGHTQKFYSVAEHCVVMATMVPVELIIHALLHDAAEAYVSDVVRPLKVLLPQFRDIERTIEWVIYEHFCVSLPGATERAAIERADLRMLRTERDQLLDEPPQPWAMVEDVSPFPLALQCWPPDVAANHWRIAIHLATVHTTQIP